LNTSRSRQKVAPEKGSPYAVLVTVVDTARLARVSCYPYYSLLS